jgi:hypothetical protein
MAVVRFTIGRILSGEKASTLTKWRTLRQRT